MDANMMLPVVPMLGSWKKILSTNLGVGQLTGVSRLLPKDIAAMQSYDAGLLLPRAVAAKDEFICTAKVRCSDCPGESWICDQLSVPLD